GSAPVHTLVCTPKASGSSLTLALSAGRFGWPGGQLAGWPGGQRAWWLRGQLAGWPGCGRPQDDGRECPGSRGHGDGDGGWEVLPDNPPHRETGALSEHDPRPGQGECAVPQA